MDCNICTIYKPLDSYELYNNGRYSGYRKTCKSCMNNKKRTNKMKKKEELSETQINIHINVKMLSEFMDDPDMIEMISKRLIMFSKWVITERKANINNSRCVTKTDEDLKKEKTLNKNSVDDRINAKVLYYQSEVLRKLEECKKDYGDHNITQCSIVLYEKSYLVYIDHPMMTNDLWNILM